jgi:hypothetical protein
MPPIVEVGAIGSEDGGGVKGTPIVPEINLTKGALLKPVDKLTRSDFFPDIIGMEEHFAFGHLFRLLQAYATGCQAG